MLVWAKWCGEGERRRVQQDIFNGKCNVSTVFLGLDHSFSDEGPPILFETMIFGGVFSEYQDRYATWDEAEEGHKKALNMILENAIREEDFELAEEVKTSLERFK